MQHLAFLVDGDKFAAARDYLHQTGVKIEEEDNGIGYCIFFNDPDGHLLEIITYHPVPDAEHHKPLRYLNYRSGTSGQCSIIYLMVRQAKLAHFEPVKIRSGQGRSGPPGSECCGGIGDDVREAYTAI